MYHYIKTLNYHDPNPTTTAMTLNKAITTLEQYNNWRRDNSFPEPNKYEMPDPKEIGEAIDVAINILKGLKQ